ncbi:MAG: hypothetical protein LLG20_00640, partial [Acidobacteriales bacterium]|nr:hypothetical protein [Terriglobales bacterium]
MAESLLWFLGGWALRVTILAALAGAVLCCFRIRDVAVRLAVWRAVIYGAMLMPVVSLVAPRIPLPIRATATRLPRQTINAASSPEIRVLTTTPLVRTPIVETQTPVRRPLSWPVVAMWVWAAVALAGLVRLAIGLWLSRKLVRASAGILPGFRESKDVTV